MHPSSRCRGTRGCSCTSDPGTYCRWDEAGVQTHREQDASAADQRENRGSVQLVPLERTMEQTLDFPVPRQGEIVGPILLVPLERSVEIGGDVQPVPLERMQERVPEQNGCFPVGRRGEIVGTPGS